MSGMRSCRPPPARPRCFAYKYGAAEVRQRKEIELPARCRGVRQGKSVSQNMQMRIELDHENVAGREWSAFFNEIPALPAQDQPVPPQCDEGPLAKILPKLSERCFVRLKFQIEALAQEYRDPQHQDRLPTELGRRALLLGTHVG